MARNGLTQKDKIERYDGLQKELDIHRLFLHDSESGAAFILATEDDSEGGAVIGKLYRPTAPSGGYVVLAYHAPMGSKVRGLGTEIGYLEDLKTHYDGKVEMGITRALPSAIVLDRLMVERNRRLRGEA